MRLLNARTLRRVGVAAAGSALAALSLGAAGASAKGNPNQCSGGNITGQGAVVAKPAYLNVFDPAFNTSTNPFACSGTQGTLGKPVVSYTATSSGKGLESWGSAGGVGSFGPTNAFVVTEEAPNAAQKAAIEANETTPGSAVNSVLTIPVAQESIAVDVHLPAGCTATSTQFPGRLVIGNATLEKIFNGSITNWLSITDGGDAFTPSAKGGACDVAITPVVRPDPAGATNVFKHYLGLINGSALPVTGGTNPEETWNELAQGTQNIKWPTALKSISSAKTGDNAEIAQVVATAGSIGYSSLANARLNTAFQPPAGGPNTAIFWAPIQNNGVVGGAKVKQTFADPSTNNEIATPAKANCAKEKYTNGQGTKFPPASAQSDWSTVTTETKQKNYSLCTLVYQLALTKYSAYAASTSGEAQTVSDFLNWILQTKGTGAGQTLINENQDYEQLPANVVKISQKGQALITF